MKRIDSRTRLRFISALCILAAGVLLTKLYFLQVVYGEEFSTRADRQYVRSSSDMFDRGSIYFTTKDGEHISAATVKTGFTLTINPTLLENPQEVWNKLSGIVEIDKDEFLLKAGKKDDPYEEIAHRLNEETAEQVEALDIEGVQVYKERWRFYPGDELASHVLGFVAFKENDLVGRYGIEEEYDGVLERSENNLYVNFFAEVFSQINETVVKKENNRAGDVYLTIEPNVQRHLEQVVRDAQEEWGSKLTAGIVVDPHTGEVVAMAATPTFNPNTFNEEEDVSVFTNPLVQNVYELGSIFKPLTMAAGLDAGVVTAQTTYNDAGTIYVDKARVSNYDGRARGVVSMQEVLNQSLNTGVAFVVDKLGADTFRSYLEKYGIRSITGVDLPGDASPLVDNLDSPRTIEYITASFGQGVAISPLSMTRALSVLANGGKLVTPHVTKKVDYEVGFTRSIESQTQEQVITPETSEEISRMLVRVVDEALKGGSVKLDRYSVAAKTGTAQMAKPGGGYYDDRYLHSFFGYFPAFDPKFLVFLMNVEPQRAQYASETLTDPFMNMTKFLINYYNIAPDR